MYVIFTSIAKYLEIPMFSVPEGHGKQENLRKVK